MRSFPGLGIVLVCALAVLCLATRYGIESSLFGSVDVVMRGLSSPYPATLSTAVREEPTTTLLFVGDVMLSRGVAWRVSQSEAQYHFPFQKVQSELAGADVLVGNLEGPISARGTNQGSEISFRASPDAVPGLRFAGFDALSLANNHIWDWGQDALRDTIEILRGNGIASVGAGVTAAEANEPVILSVNGLRIALLAFTTLYPKTLEATAVAPGVSATKEKQIVERVRAARWDADVLVVLLHWGDEYRTEPALAQRTFGRLLVDSGADFVIGSHSHVRGPLEQYQTGWIAYSLGNFVFDRGVSDETRNGMMLRVTYRGSDVVRVEEVPIRLNDDFQPEIISV